MGAFLLCACDQELVPRTTTNKGSRVSGTDNVVDQVAAKVALGDSCTSNDQCDSEHCFAYAASTSICSKTCDTDTDCALMGYGFVCKQAVASGLKLCAPTSAGQTGSGTQSSGTGTQSSGTGSSGTVTGTKAFGADCSASTECADGYCFRPASAVTPICSKSCQSDAGCSNGGVNSKCLATTVSGLSLCGPGSSSTGGTGGTGGSTGSGSSTPGPGEYGSSCSGSCDCDSNLCVRVSGGNPFCTELCQTSADCPSGTCIAGGGTKFCMP